MDGDSDNEESVQPKDINHFSARILNAPAEISFADDGDEELPDLTEVQYYCSVSRWRPHKVDKRMVLEYTHGLFIT